MGRNNNKSLDMDGVNKTLVVIMIIILVIIGISLFAPRSGVALNRPYIAYVERHVPQEKSTVYRQPASSTRYVSQSYTYIPGRVDVYEGSTQVCTMDALRCPDGSYVGRTGPNCSFAPCGAY